MMIELMELYKDEISYRLKFTDVGDKSALGNNNAAINYLYYLK